MKKKRKYTRFSDISGQIIGKYKVLKNTKISNRHRIDDRFDVECLDCGEITNVRRDIINKSKRGDPCAHHIYYPEQFVGRTIGKYHILEFIEEVPVPNSHKNFMYKCKCLRCGLTTIVSLDNMRTVYKSGDEYKMCVHDVPFPEELVNTTFGKYEVLELLQKSRYKKDIIYKVRCGLCGWEGTKTLHDLLNNLGEKNERCSHGGIDWPEGLNQMYQDMLQRCYNSNDSSYCRYGDAGITVCDEWLGYQGKLNFIKFALENGYEPNKGLTVDRLDASKGYGPNNVQIVSKKSNNTFTRATNSIRIKYPGFDKIGSMQFWSLFFDKQIDYFSYHFPQKNYINRNERLKDIAADILEKLSDRTESLYNKSIIAAMVELDVKPNGDYNEDGEFIYKVDNLQLIIDKEEKGDFDFDLSKLRKDNDDDDNKD